MIVLRSRKLSRITKPHAKRCSVTGRHLALPKVAKPTIENHNPKYRVQTSSPKEDIRVYPGPPRSDPKTRPQEPPSSSRPDPANRYSTTQAGTRTRKPEYQSKRPSRSRNVRPRSSLYSEKSYEQSDHNSTQQSSSGSRFADSARQLKSSFRAWIN